MPSRVSGGNWGEGPILEGFLMRTRRGEVDVRKDVEDGLERLDHWLPK